MSVDLTVFQPNDERGLQKSSMRLGVFKQTINNQAVEVPRWICLYCKILTR